MNRFQTFPPRLLYNQTHSPISFSRRKAQSLVFQSRVPSVRTILNDPPPPRTRSGSSPSKSRSSLAPPLPKGVSRKDLVIKALEDEWPLSATLFEGKEACRRKENVVLISTATGVPASFYESFAAYLASEGSPTLCFDFRLCGNSFPPTTSSSTPTKGSSLSEEDRISALKAHPEVGFSYWAQRDYSSVCLYAFSELCKGRGLTVLGNSLGGHLAPIAIHTCIQKDPSFTVDRVLMQASINPYFAMNPNREATRVFTHLMLEGLEEDGFMDCMKWSLGNNIPKQAGKDWMNSSLQPNYIGSLPFAREAFNNYRTDTLGLSFSDDGFVNGVRRKIDGFSRILGCADSIESEEEVQFWTSGKAGSMENGLPPDSLMHQSQQQKIDRNGWLNASMLLDPQLNGWVKGSTDLKEGEEDKRPRQIGHVDAYRPVVGMEGSKSREVWEVLRDFLQKGILPEQGDERLRGLGGRRDFGIRSEVKPRL